ncbi:MAG: SHOCT domain-containing protein [Oscillospiraceae bacterium]|nr:SHOCT domain-containing protein [Oscillospiraceae bacterium]
MNEGDAIVALRGYKDLLDSGVITKEEFDAKKKQLLGS